MSVSAIVVSVSVPQEKVCVVASQSSLDVVALSQSERLNPTIVLPDSVPWMFAAPSTWRDPEEVSVS